MAEPLEVKDCALAAISTGRRAHSLRELVMQLSVVEPSSVYYHFWGGRLRPRFDDPEFQNDFAAWARHRINDHVLAERLGIIDPMQFRDLEELRREVIDVIEERLAESEYTPYVHGDEYFTFIRAQTVVFDTHVRIPDPRGLRHHVRHLSLGSVFYHFIDARQRPPEGTDDFRVWLEQFEEAASLRQRLGDIDPYFCTLTELRARLALAVEAEVA